MEADTASVRDTVMRAVQAGPLAGAVRSVQVERARAEDDDEFLRVELIVELPDRNVDAELEALLERIEDAVAAVDDRYASVRFLDAA